MTKDKKIEGRIDLFHDTVAVSDYIARDGKWVVKYEFETIRKSAAVT